MGIIGPGSVMGQVVGQVYSKNGSHKSPLFLGGLWHEKGAVFIRNKLAEKCTIILLNLSKTDDFAQHYSVVHAEALGVHI